MERRSSYPRVRLVLAALLAVVVLGSLSALAAAHGPGATGDGPAGHQYGHGHGH